MKKITFVFLFSLIHSILILGQWDSLGSGVQQNIEYGYGVYAQAVYDGKLYFGGEFDTAGGIPATGIATWDGVTWSVPGNLDNNRFVNSYIIYNGSLIAGGGFDSINGIAANNIASWNGSVWSALGSGRLGQIKSLAVYNGNLYAGGTFLNRTRNYNIAMWNGTAWDTVGSGVPIESDIGICALTVYNGNLYAGGKFDSIGGIWANNIAMWNGSTWSSVGTGFNDSAIGALTVFNWELYAGGRWGSSSNSLGVIAKWNGNSWSGVGGSFTGSRFNGSNINALSVFDSSVCVAGIFDSVGDIAANSIAYWNGSSWGTFGNGIYGTVFSLGVYNSELYAAGRIYYAGNKYVNNIAVWTGVLGIPGVSNSKFIPVFPNPNNGKFVINLSSVSEESDLKIYNVLGEDIYSTKLNHENTQIDLSNNSSGIYLFRVLGKSGNLIDEGKFIIQK